MASSSHRFYVQLINNQSGRAANHRPPLKHTEMKTSTTTVSISIQGIELEVTGTYTPEESQTRDYPGCSSEFEIESVKLADPDADIFDLIDYSVKLDDMVTAAIEAYEGQHGGDMDSAWEDYCDAREEERKLNI